MAYAIAFTSISEYFNRHFNVHPHEVFTVVCMSGSLFRHVIVPVVSEDDAVATAQALLPYVEGSETVVAVHVIEKTSGAPDTAAVEQQELVADAIFDTVATELRGTDVALQTEYLYGTDIAETVMEAANEFEASAIVFTPRGSSRWLKLLAGDVTTPLVNESDVPVLVLPDRSNTTS